MFGGGRCVVHWGSCVDPPGVAVTMGRYVRMPFAGWLKH